MADCTELEKSGWFVNTSSVSELLPDKRSADELAKALLDVDLKHVGRLKVAESTWKAKADNVNGPLVLQIQKLRNVNVPKENEEGLSSNGPRLLKVVLTDGLHTINAVELENVPGISLNTPPGSKLKLTGRVQVCNGHLLLSKSNCKPLGGHVPALVENWTLKRSLASHNRDSGRGDGGPPPFVPFAERYKAGERLVRGSDGFKSLDSGGKKKEADSEFEQQRKATIEAALQEQVALNSKVASNKQQQVDRDIASIVEMGFTVQQATSALQSASGNVQVALNSLLQDGNQPAAGPAVLANGRRDSSNDNQKNRSNTASAAHDGYEIRGAKGDVSSHSGGGGRPDGSQRDRPGGTRDRDSRESRRGPRRGREDRGEDSYGRPSAPATLFDFVTSKMPQSSISQAAQDPGKKDRSPSPEQQQQQPPSRSNESSAPVVSAPAPSSHQTSAPLPPRLQRKQRQVEEEKYMKYYKPMEYIRQSNFSHSATTVPAASSGPRTSADVPARHVHDINSRGAVRNKTLWTDNEVSTGNARQNEPNGRVNDDSSETRRSYNKERSNQRVCDTEKAAKGHGKAGRTVQWSEPEVRLIQTSPEHRGSAGDLETSVAAMNLNPVQPHVQPVDRTIQPNSKLGSGGRPWQVGDMCMAKYWQDKQDMYGTPADGHAMMAAYHTQAAAVAATAPVQYPSATPQVGHSVVYQPVNAPPLGSASGVAPGSNIYFTQPFIASTYPNTIYDPAVHGVIVAGQPGTAAATVSTAPVPGILIQGPPPSAPQPQAISLYAAAPPLQHMQASDVTAMHDGQAGIMKATRLQQHYAPQSQRK